MPCQGKWFLSENVTLFPPVISRTILILLSRHKICNSSFIILTVGISGCIRSLTLNIRTKAAKNRILVHLIESLSQSYLSFGWLFIPKFFRLFELKCCFCLISHFLGLFHLWFIKCFVNIAHSFIKLLIFKQTNKFFNIA